MTAAKAKAKARKPPPRRVGPPCRDCGERESLDGTGQRCEPCWALACQTWFWNGLAVNALPHARRHR